jgi:uncharacterized protein YndB with AHSA1/START domain
MRTVERSIEIAAPRERVFGFLSELDNLPRWQAGILSTEKTTSGPMQPGEQAHVVRQLMGQRIEADLVVTAYEPPARLELESEVSGVRALAVIEVAEAGSDRSSVTFSMQISASGFAAFMEGMVASAAEQDIANSLQMLQRELEGT